MTKVAAVYVRISSDPTGARLGVRRQVEDCRAKAEALGWRVAAIYEDNDVSASTGKRRPEYERMLTDIEAGRIDAVIVWDLDRLTRRPIEIEEFIDLADRRGVALASVGGDVDLATDNGRLFARIKGAVARAEVERKSTRQKRANLQRAESGGSGGGRRPFGYLPGRTEVAEDEAAEIRKAADGLLAGCSLRGVVADLNARGARTSMGGPWHPTEFRRLLLNPRIAGLVRYRGEIMGKGKWPAILDEDTFHAVGAVLSDPARRKAGPPRRHLLSGIARCAVCDGRLFGVSEKGKGALYRCESRRHVSARAEPIDDLVLRVIAARLARPDAVTLLATASQSDEAATLRQKDSDLRSRLDGLAEAFAGGEIDRRQLSAGTARLRRELEHVGAALSQLARSPVLTDLVTAEDVGAMVRRLYDEDLDRLRSVIGALIEIRVRPPGRGARVFDPGTVEITWKSS